jgi:hypothetical protein
MLKYCRGLPMIHTLRFQYTSLSNMERYPVQSRRENGLVLPLQVDAYSTFSYVGCLIDKYRLVSEEYEPANLRVSVTGDQDGVYKDQVLQLSGDGPMKPTLLLIGKRLGHDNVNPLYYSSLKVTPSPPEQTNTRHS